MLFRRAFFAFCGYFISVTLVFRLFFHIDRQFFHYIPLVICNQKSQVVFQYMDLKQDRTKINKEQSAALLEELRRTGISLSAVLKKHKLNKLSDMSPELWATAMEAMKNTADKAA